MLHAQSEALVKIKGPFPMFCKYGEEKKLILGNAFTNSINNFPNKEIEFSQKD